jgi:putative Ca2+/H+ antiporter (TMEM165/GDT1 family)
MGDKTQIATVALAAKYHDMLAVVAGTTLGMLIADAPAVWVGDRLSRALPVTLIHRIAATLFAVIGIWVLVAG